MYLLGPGLGRPLWTPKEAGRTPKGQREEREGESAPNRLGALPEAPWSSAMRLRLRWPLSRGHRVDWLGAVPNCP